MEHFLHLDIKLRSRQKYRQCTGVFVVAQMCSSFMRWQAVWMVRCVNLNTNCTSTFAVFTPAAVTNSLWARPKMINSNSQALRTCGYDVNPSSLPILAKCLSEFANLGCSSCLCRNKNLEGTYFRSLCVPMSNWSPGLQRSCFERTQSGEEMKSDGFLD